MSQWGILQIEYLQEAELEASGCDTAVTIECLRDLYHFDYEPLSAKKNTIAVGRCAETVTKDLADTMLIRSRI